MSFSMSTAARNTSASSATATNGTASGTSAPPRKKRRSRKGLDKRFECKVPGCGKSYSRAEHLQRHQLNHNSAQTYYCEQPDCTRTFVRLDLLKRHLERHSTTGKAQASGTGSPIEGNPNDGGSTADASADDTKQSRSRGGVPPPGNGYSIRHNKNVAESKPEEPLSFGSGNNGLFGQNMQGGQMQASHGRHGVGNQMGQSPPTFQMQSMNVKQGGYRQGQSQFMYQPDQHQANGQFNMDQTMQNRNAFNQFNQPSTAGDFSTPTTTQPDMMMVDHMSMTGVGFPVDMLQAPMVGMPVDFMAYLFNPGPDVSGLPPPSLNYGDLSDNAYDTQSFEVTPTAFNQVPAGPYNVMAVNNLVDADTPEALISEDRSQEIYDFIKDRFSGHSHVSLQEMRESIVGGDREDDHHMLSRKMMQAYIWSYWHSFSEQLPIIHRGSFSAESTPTLLLLAMMAIGSACLDKTHGTAVTMAGAKVSNFIATHLRWELFMDPSFRAPAKLWVFQTLLVLELYEKMCSTRQLHERAHIHHATTITLMRRGRSLIGKSTLDEPGVTEDLTSSRHSSTAGHTLTKDEWWHNWIVNESTKRAACAAFVIDSIHSSMFGHSGVMVAHEMRLPLPCDDSLWRATSGAEVVRGEAGLKSQGIKPMSFLEGLKCTLNNLEVNTTAFGRTVLMAGLLSVTHHMHQRDLQVNVLGGGVGVVQAMDGRDKWRAQLTRAYDFWKANFDKGVEQSNSQSDPYRNGSSKTQPNVIFESRTVLHDLAHMAMHADIVDCQMYAGAKRLLGRPVGALEFNAVQKRIKEYWAPSARARDAAFYALQFLRSVLAPDLSTRQDGANPIQEQPYDTRHDVLLNRPWVLYFAALVLWCYGYASEGACPNAVAPPTQEEQWMDMRSYLANYAIMDKPDSLRTARGVNRNTSLLLVLKESFENSRWELLHEAAALLGNCVVLNSGATLQH